MDKWNTRQLQEVNKPEDQPQAYTFVFNSIGRSGGASSARPSLNVDWSVIPDQPYLVYFSYLGETNTVNTTGVPSVYCSALDGCAYQASSGNGRTQTLQTTLLGLLRPDFIGTSSYIYADYKTNPPVYMPYRPRDNQCRFDITYNAISPTYITYNPESGQNNLQPYILTMLFVPAPPDTS